MILLQLYLKYCIDDKRYSKCMIISVYLGEFQFPHVLHRHLFLTLVIPSYYYKVPHSGSAGHQPLHCATFLIILSLNTLIFLIYFRLEDIISLRTHSQLLTLSFIVINCTLIADYCFPISKTLVLIHPLLQARRQEFPEGGSPTRIASRAPRKARCSYGRGCGGRSRPQEALGYLEQNPEI